MELDKHSFITSQHRKLSIFTLILECLLFLPFFITGCSVSNPIISYDANASYCTKPSRLPLSEAMCTQYTQSPGLEYIDVSVVDSEIYILAKNKENYEVIRGDTKGKEIQTHLLPSFDKGTPLRMFIRSDGCFIILTEETGSTLWSQNYYSYVMDEKGEVSVADKQLIIPDEGQLLDVAYDVNQDRIWVLSDTSLSSYNSKGELQSNRTSSGDDVFLSLSVTDSDLIYLLVQNDSFEIWELTDEARNRTGCYVLEGMTDQELFLAKLTSLRNKDGVILIDTPYAVYELILETKELHVVLGKTYEEYTSLARIISDEGQYFVMAAWWGNDISRDFGIYSFTVEKNNVQKVRIAVIGLDESLVDEISISLGIMRQKNPNVSVEIQVYTEQYLFGKTGNRMDAPSLLSLLADDLPDVFCVSDSYLRILKNAGMLTDLATLYENDTSFDTSDLIPSVWNAAKQTDGHFYITPFVGLQGVMAKRDSIMYAQVASLSEFEAWTRSYSDDAHIVRHDTPELLFEMLWPFYAANLTSEGSQFDENTFADLLEFCYKNGKEPYKDYVPVRDQIEDQKLMLCWADIANFDDFLGYSSYFEGDTTLIGLPGNDGGEPMLTSSMYFSVADTSKNKEDAWKVVAFMLSPEVQNRYESFAGVGKGIPVLSSAFDLMIDTQYQKCVNGESSFTGVFSDAEDEARILEIQKYMEQMAANNQDRQPPQTASFYYLYPKETVEKAMRSAVSNASQYAFSDPDLMNIALEEAKLFFAGECTAKEAASRVAGQIHLYISE